MEISSGVAVPKKPLKLRKTTDRKSKKTLPKTPVISSFHITESYILTQAQKLQEKPKKVARRKLKVQTVYEIPSAAIDDIVHHEYLSVAESVGNMAIEQIITAPIAEAPQIRNISVTEALTTFTQETIVAVEKTGAQDERPVRRNMLIRMLGGIVRIFTEFAKKIPDYD